MMLKRSANGSVLKRASAIDYRKTPNGNTRQGLVRQPHIISATILKNSLNLKMLPTHQQEKPFRTGRQLMPMMASRSLRRLGVFGPIHLDFMICSVMFVNGVSI